ERKFETIFTTAPVTNVDDSSFSFFCSEIFRSIDESGNDNPHQFLMCSPDHVMAVTLRAKNGVSGQREYVLRFFDPKHTKTHKRLVLYDPQALARLQSGAADWTLTELLGDQDAKNYFGSGQPCASLYEVGASK